jgi:glucokinase
LAYDVEMATYIGIEIGGTKLQIVAGDADGTIRRRWRATADRTGGGAGICRQLQAGIDEIRSGIEVRAIGVGFGGPVDRKTGCIARSHQIDGWEGFELRNWLARETGVPVAVENDSNLAVLAEANRGAGAGQNPVFYFNLGSGVGGGLVTDGCVYHGMPPGEAEFGHLLLDRGGGTVESRCSGWAIDQRIRSVCSTQPDTVLARTIGPTSGGESKQLAAAISRGDPVAQSILSELSDDLAFALSHVVQLLHPEVLVVGGGLALVGEPLRQAIADALPRYVMKVFAPGPPVALARLREDAVPTGALLLSGQTEL